MLCDHGLWTDVAFPEHHEVHHVALTEPDIGRLADEVLSAVPGPFVLVGLSLGAIVGFEVLRRAPERVAGFCAMSTNAGAPRPEQYAAWRTMDALIAEGRFEEVIEQTLPGMFDVTQPPGDFADRYRSMAHRVGPDAARAQLAAQATRSDAHETLRSARCPMTVLYGMRDALCPPDFHRAIAEAAPDARLRAVPGAGHLLPIQQPGSVSAAVRDLLVAAKRTQPAF
ncbi:alpha/beta fold hydrolase [Streptomyces ochraceiscleroticus]|uniref:Alpha/beta fold hydrolase n=1 Tax=Streptomyces ochraceiscleroticus TaxID=47761 RepID=A0ABW1MJV5_9ACTN|nr:alpha/beta hydrolase [Streptomyces ochraceiscleroticus]